MDRGAGVQEAREGARFCLGPLVVDADGRVRAEAGQPTRFAVRWRGRATAARLHADGRLDLVTAVAWVPSSVHLARTDVRRQDVFLALRGLPSLLPPSWRMVLRPDHQVGIEAERRLPVPVAAEDLLVELTMFLLELDPYLPLFEGEGLEARKSEAARVTPPRQARPIQL